MVRAREKESENTAERPSTDRLTEGPDELSDGDR
jgi:hypothetical protein